MDDSAKSVIPQLIPFLKDPDRLTQQYASESLQKLGYKSLSKP
jgi:hypothetical protein